LIEFLEKKHTYTKEEERKKKEERKKLFLSFFSLPLP